MRGRGLKHPICVHQPVVSSSPPMRGRGLKPYIDQELPGKIGSPPMRGRGLKPLMLVVGLTPQHVAPHAGAWIETVVANLEFADDGCRPPCGGVD